MEEAAAITPRQAQGLTVALRMLERILFSVEELCAEESGRLEGALVSLDNPLRVEQRAHLAEMAQEGRATIAGLAERFKLKHETAGRAKEVHGRLVQIWATLEDSKSSKLKRYGGVNPALAAQLDPGVEKLISLVLAMDQEIIRLETQEERPEGNNDGR